MKTKIFVGKLYKVIDIHLPVWTVGRAGYDVPNMCKLRINDLFVVLHVMPFNTVIMCLDGDIYSCYECHITENARRVPIC